MYNRRVLSQFVLNPDKRKPTLSVTMSIALVTGLHDRVAGGITRKHEVVYNKKT